MRDIEKNPYSKDEQRVAEWLCERSPFGGGDDPIGFVLCSYDFMVAERRAKASPPGDDVARLVDTAWLKTHHVCANCGFLMKCVFDTSRHKEWFCVPCGWVSIREGDTRWA